MPSDNLSSEPSAPKPADDLSWGETLRGFRSGQRVLGRYELRAHLGGGGMGEVWRTFDTRLEREVALKFLPEAIRHDPAALKDLKRETQRALDLTHPNIVRIYDYVEDATHSAIAMELVEGETLAARRAGRANDLLEVAELRPLVRQLCEALHYAHTQARVVHRDLKPANLMVTREGVLKIADFGIAQILRESATRLTFQGSVSGTLPYMSPQQLRGQRPEPADDIYALGATLFELLAGKPPFFRGDLAVQIREETPGSVGERRQELALQGEPVPAAWEVTIAACLAKDPPLRPASAAEVARRLEGDPVPVAAPNSAPVAAVAPPIVETSRKPGRLRGLAWGVGVMLLLAGFWGWYFRVQLPEQRRREEMAEREFIQLQREIEVLAVDDNTGDLARLRQRVEEYTRTAPAGRRNQLKRLLTEKTEAIQHLEEHKAASAHVAVETQALERHVHLNVASRATQSDPFVNSLGMKFVPVPGTEVLFSIWETRRQDYEAYANAVSGVDGSWKDPGFAQGGTQPVVNVNWGDAQRFAAWLTEKERGEGKLTMQQVYRLPTDLEWSQAVGLISESGSTPKERNGKIADLYPWGTQWPPPFWAGNYDSYSSSAMNTDTFNQTSPAGSFAANQFGLFDLGGNVWEWCEDWYDGEQIHRVLRGGSWTSNDPHNLLSSFRLNGEPNYRNSIAGFRLVLVVVGSAH